LYTLDYFLQLGYAVHISIETIIIRIDFASPTSEFPLLFTSRALYVLKRII